MKCSLALAVLVCASSAYSASQFSNGQAARAVIGQYEFTQHNYVGGPQIIGANAGLAYDPVHGYLWSASGNLIGLPPVNNDVLGFSVGLIPGVDADLSQYGGYNSACHLCAFPASFVQGQVDFNSFVAGRSQVATSNAAGSMSSPTAVATDGTYFAVVDTGNDRVLIWNHVPQSNNVAPDVVVGQPDFTTLQNVASVTASSLRAPQGAWIQNGKLFVADTGNNRVLIWNSIPTTNGQAADLVLGQSNFTSNTAPSVTTATTQPVAAANLLWNPISVTESPDGTHLFIADFAYSRVLIWNSIPSSNDQPADVEVGQANMAGSTANDVNNLCQSGLARCEKTLSLPRYALSDGTRLFIADSGNDRVLVYNTIPTSNAAAADEVIGQPDFISNVIQPNESVVTQFVSNTGSVDTVPTPTALAWDGTNLYVADPTDGRILAFSPGDIPIPGTQILNNASELLRQEGLIEIAETTIVSGDTITVTIGVNGTSPTYTYTVASGDTLATIVTGVVNAINSGSGDPNVTAQSVPNVAGTVLLIAKSATADLNTISYSAVASNTADLTVGTAGEYLTGGTSGTLAPGTIFEIDNPNGTVSGGGLVDFPFEAADTTQQLPTTLNGPTGTSSSVQVYVDGLNVPILSASPTQIVAQIPYTFEQSADGYIVDRNSISIYVRSVRNDGSVVVTTPAPAAFTDGNPGLFGVRSTTEPRAAIGATHQPGNPSVTVSLGGSVTAGDSVSITVNGSTYSYTATSTDSLNTIAQALTAQINAANNSSATAAYGAAGTVIVSARAAGAAGVGIPVTAAVAAASGSSTTETVTTSLGTTCCSDSGTGPVTATNPVLPNEIVTFLATGLGNVYDASGNVQQIVAGLPYALAQPNTVANAVNATVNGTGATVIDAGIPNGSIGVYNVQVQMPSSLATTGVIPVYIAQNAFISNTVTVPVGPPAAGSATGALILNVDSPSNNAALVGATLTAYGWAADPNATVPTIALYLDGTALAAPTRVSRPDVCAAYPTVPDCGAASNTPGWSESINLSGLALGSHTLTVIATATNGDTNSQSVIFTLPEQAVLLSIDAPANNPTAQGVLNAYGWAADPISTVPTINLFVDGNAVPAPTRVNRADVCAAYPNERDCQDGNPVGWVASIGTGNLSIGSHTLTVTAVAANGLTTTAQSTFNVANDLTLNLDSPQSGATLSGTAQIYGWATSFTASMPANNVILRVDGGAPIATTSVARPDVCTAVPTAVDCQNGNQNVGFMANLNTAQFANGTHTLIAESTNANGLHRTVGVTITINNTSASLQGSIDLPQSGQTLVGQVSFFGWAGSATAAVTRVAVSIDGVSMGNAALIARPDVCAAFPSIAACPNGTPGWSFPLDTTTLSDGSHQLQIVSYSAASIQTQSSTFSVANWTTTNPLHENIDAPSGTVSGVIPAYGWVLSDQSAITSITTVVDGVPLPSTYGVARTDVCATYPGRTGCPNVGWSAQLDTTRLSNGQHTFSLTAKAANGQVYTIANNFTVANTNSNITVYIDTNLASALTSAIQITGWAGSTNAAVTSVQLSLDGQPIGQTAETIARPDVCAAYPTEVGCPNGNLGYSFSFNPTLYGPGTHVLAATAFTGSGSQTITQNITIAQPASPTVRIFMDTPSSGATYTGTVRLSGWDVDANGNSGTVTFTVDSVPVALSVSYAARPDVCATFQYSTGCAQAGWSTLLDTTTLPDGTHTLAITSATSAGTATISRQFTVANWTNFSPIQITLTSPAANLAVAGSTVLAGTAVTQTGTITAVTVTIDNLIVAQPATYSVATGTWSFPFDSTLLPDGTHTVEITAVSPQAGELSSTQQQNTISTTFTSQNYSY